MTTVTIHNKSKLDFKTKAGAIKAGSFAELEKELGENLLKSYPNQLQAVKSSIKQPIADPIKKDKKGKSIQKET